MINIVEAILTAKSMQMASLLVIAIRKSAMDLNRLTKEEIKAMAMFHAAGLYHAYKMGLEHGRAGTPLDTSFIDSVINDHAKEQSNETQKP